VLDDAPAGFWDARIVPADQSITSNPVFAQVAAQSTAPTHASLGTLTTLVVEQPLLPLVSYPSEWSFEMLRDAALLTLQIESDLLDRGLSLKDATAFNIAFDGSRPVHFDCHSVERHTTKGLWPAYGQFCRSLLIPLLVWSHRKIDPRPLLLTGLAEISLHDGARLLGMRNAMRKGVLAHVLLPSLLDRMMSGKKAQTSGAVARIEPPLEHLKKTITKLAELIKNLPNPQAKNGRSDWSDCVKTCTYSSEETKQKAEFVSAALTAFQPDSVIDLGCNTGFFSRLAATHATKVIAADLDPACVDRVYQQAKNDPAQRSRVFPLVLDFSRPTPAVGWSLTERKDALSRIKCDAFLALAVVHHLRISGIPVAEIARGLSQIAPKGVLEWVGPADPMVQELNAFRKLDLHDLEWEPFVAVVAQFFVIQEVLRIENKHRALLRVGRLDADVATRSRV
jgi:SAM-dependent methyltransferase